MCLAVNRQTPATEVDHIIPWGNDPKLFWDNEFQGLCRECHSQKTWYETTKSPYLPNNIRPKSKDITLLFGANGSGRHEWADKQDATVISIERIKDVIGHEHHKMPTCIATRNQMIEKTKGKVIIIEELPNPRYRQDWIKKLNAKPILMVTPQHKCNGCKAKIQRWFDEFRPLGNESFAQAN